MKKILISLIKAYQKCFSILLPPRCRFYPSCSNYAITAIEKKGLVLGIFFTLWRLLKCNPLFPGGYDPVD